MTGMPAFSPTAIASRIASNTPVPSFALARMAPLESSPTISSICRFASASIAYGWRVPFLASIVLVGAAAAAQAAQPKNLVTVAGELADLKRKNLLIAPAVSGLRRRQLACVFRRRAIRHSG